VNRYHDTFNDLRDAILIVQSGEKGVSSSAGHALMEKNPFAPARFQQAGENLLELKAVLERGDWDRFIELLEREALTLHAMMMTGKPGYLLMQPGTLSIIQKIRRFREETGSRAGFTLDAGANVHLIYDGKETARVEPFITSELVMHCEEGRVIRDGIGEGPVRS
jgi:diphosphomevalonate decarboxylase